MGKAVCGKWIVSMLVWALFLGTIVPADALIGQETQDRQADAAQAAPDTKPPAASPPRGRLPAYFSSVVTKDQREEIYKVQARYAEQLAKLQEQVAMLVAERDVAVDAVLTVDQLAIVKQKREEARQRREARRSSQPASP